MAGVTFDDKAFQKALAEKARRMAHQAGELTIQVGDEIAKAARSRAPSRSGRMKRSIKSTPGRDAQGPYADVTVGPFYSSFVEWGTSEKGARPFMRPAAEQAKSAVIRGAPRIAR